MRIDRIEIKNFHGIEQAEYDLHPEATILLGANAMGKSAILDALAILAGSYFLGLDGVPSLTIRNGDIRQELRFYTDGSTQRVYHTPCWLHAVGEVHGQPDIAWTRDRQSLSGKTRVAEAKGVADLAEAALKAFRDGTQPVRPFLGYYSVARLGAQKKETSNQQKALSDERAGYMNALDKESSQWAAERWFAGLQSRAQGGLGEAAAIFAISRRKLLSLFQGVDRPLGDVRHDPDTNALVVRFEDAQGFVPTSFLSSGYQSVLSMGLDIIYRIFVLNPHLGAEAFDRTPGIALVDETDMHLHAKWQRCIVDDLRAAFPALQFVFTTHSAFVVQSLRHARIIDLDNGTTHEVGEHIKKSIPEVAEDYLGMDDLERSPYFMEQTRAAEEYFTLLREAPNANPEKLAALKARLDEFEIRYDRDPAMVALWRVERKIAGVDKP